MSDTVRSYGYIAIVEHSYTKEEINLIQEQFYDDDSNLSFTYDGNCIYYDFNRNKDYDECTDIYITQVGSGCVTKDNKFFEELNKYNITIKPNTTVPFNCIWYNGSDCPIDMLTKERVLEGCNE